MERKRVGVLGMGVVTPLGITVEGMWRNLLGGVSGVGLNTFHTFSSVAGEFDPAALGLKETVAAEVKDFKPQQLKNWEDIRHEEPFSWFACAAADQAMAQAGLVITDAIRDRVAVVIGTGMGGLTTLEDQHRILREEGARRVSPFLIPRIMPNAAAGVVARRFGCCGPSVTHAGACATGAVAIGEALCMIREGRADVAIAGGSEAVITPLNVAGFVKMRALAKRTDDPQRRSRPFDRDRDGFVIGEGAGIMILVSYEFAAEYGLTPLAQIAGYGLTQDAYHVTAPHPEGIHAARAMRLALQDAGVESDEVVYINPHSTGTSADSIETLAIKAVFGKRAAHIPISSSKSMLGHLIGAAGTVEAIIGVMTLLEGKAHPAINLENVDPKCTGLDHILGGPRAIPPGPILTNSFGFGGSNAVLVLRPILRGA